MRVTEEQFHRILERYLNHYRKTHPTDIENDVLKVRYAAAFKSAIEFLEQHVRDGLLNLAALGAEDDATFTEQQDKFLLLCQFLDASLLVSADESPVKFAAATAAGLKAVILDPKLSASDRVYIYDTISNLSIREKYSRGMLTAQHWLTDLDLQRALRFMGLEAKVSVMPFTAPSLGAALHFARKDHEAATEAYTVPFLLNLGSQGEGQGTHWIAATVTVDPLRHQISYKIDDSLSLTPTQIARYKQVMEEAIKFDDGFHKAYSDWPIAEDPAPQITGHATQTDGYSCGYRALHHLLQDASLAHDHPNAEAYGAIDASASANLVRAFYRQQLEDFAIPRDVFTVLSGSARAAFTAPLVRDAKSIPVASERLGHFIAELPTKMSLTPRTAIRDAIAECTGAYRPDVVLMRFPERMEEESVDAVQYATLFEQLSQVVQLQSKESPLPQFILTRGGIAALDGLNDYYAENAYTPFKELTINIDLAAEEDIDSFVAKLKFALNNLSKNNLEHLVIHDEKNKLQEKHIKEIVDIVKAQRITVAIDLPAAFAKTDYQRQIDREIAINRREKSSRLLMGMVPEAAVGEAKKKESVRQRQRVDLKAAMKIDIELQEGIDETVMVAAAAPQQLREDTTDYSALPIFRSSDVLNAKRDNNFSAFKGIAGGLSKQGFMLYWDDLLGNITTRGQLLANGELNGISAEALEQLIKYKAYFNDGINTRELPPGFMMIADPKDPSGRVLHYDKGLNQSSVFSPKPLLSSAEKPVLSMDMVDRLVAVTAADKSYVTIWQAIKSAATYSREDSRLFRQYLPDLMRLSDEHLATVVRLCGGTDAFDVRKLGFIFNNLDKAKQAYVSPYDENALIDISWLEAVLPTAADREAYINFARELLPKAVTVHPLLSLLEKDGLTALKDGVASARATYTLTDVELNGMLAIYDKYGSQGLEKLLGVWQTITAMPGVTPSHTRSVQSHVAGYEALLLNSDVQEAARIISGFTTEQRQWWDMLLNQHAPKDDYLPNLVQSFAAFSRIIAEKGLSFYPLDVTESHFRGGGNLPTTLGRMISILNMCKEDDRAMQWQAISHIDLSSSGAIRAMTDGLRSDRACRFVLREMAVTPGNAVAKGYDDKTGVYDIYQHPAYIQGEGDELLRSFYGYLAHQKYRLPLSFYKEMIDSLEAIRKEGSIPSESIAQLYRFLADATTGDNCRFFITDVATAKTQWQGIIENIKTIHMPVDVLTTRVKRSITDTLAKLGSLPALPVLGKLVRLITAPLKNVTLLGLPGLSAKANKLDESNIKLNGFVRKYGAKIYQGMKFYEEADFTRTYPEGRDIFEQHLHISAAIERAGVAYELLPFISTYKISSANVDALSLLIKDIKKPLPVDDGMPAPEPNETDKFKEILLDYALDLLTDIDSTEGLDGEAMRSFLTNLTPIVSEARLEFKRQCEALLAKREFGTPNILELALKANDLDSEKRAQVLSYAKTAIQDLVEAKFKRNFSSDYFEKLRANRPQGKVELLIDQSFKDESLKTLVLAIQMKYGSASNDDMMRLIGLLASICEELSTSEKIGLLSTLKDERLLSAPINDYTELLTAISQHGHASFVYFMGAADKFPGATDELTLKARYFLSQALPEIRGKKDASFSEIDVVDLAADLVLAAKPDEISSEIELKPDLTRVYAQLQAAISTKDTAQIQTALIAAKAANPDSSRWQALLTLEEHIADLTTSEYIEIHIPPVIKMRPVTVTRHQELTGLERMMASLRGQPLIRAVTIKENKPYVEVEGRTERRLKEKTIQDRVLDAARDELKAKAAEAKSYTFAFAEAFGLIDKLVSAYPAAKDPLLSLSRRYLSFSPSGEKQIQQAFNHLRLVGGELIALHDQDLVISLCEHFGGTPESAFSYKELLAIFQGQKLTLPTEPPVEVDFAGYPLLSQKAKSQILRVVSSLLNNDKPCSLQDIAHLIRQCSEAEQGERYVEILGKLFENAPFPTLDMVDSWVQRGRTDAAADIVAHVVLQYTEWNKAPVARESINGFDLTHAKEQARRMQGVTYTDEELQSIANQVAHARSLTTVDLLREIKGIKNTEGDNPAKLVGLMAELLYRTKGLPQEGIGESRKWGRSFEINTTQYLAIHAMLKSGGHVTSQIGTGEGKSRIMAMAIACQYALGNTVDFVTSDLSLATRDYLEYQAFFKFLGAETNLIYAHTPPTEYRLGGINFSDASNLSLFRNKARSEGQGALVMAADASQRSLMLDEADTSYFDAERRFNYSAQADYTIRDMPWIYELMVLFFSQEDKVELYYADADACNEAFYNFARSKLDAHQMARLIYNPKDPQPVVSRNQLEAWQSSALTALQLKADEDYIIKPDITILTKEGPRTVSQAQLISGSRASGNAKFSFGVHQCLHAMLNLARIQGQHADAPAFSKYLATLKAPFYIDSENQIVYSSTSKSLVDDYKDGNLLAVTGTAGAIREREEAAELFGKGKSPMVFVDVPRHRGLKREDLPVALAKDAQAHQQQILAAIRVSLAKNPPQPVLLVCENDTESKALYTFLQTNLTAAEKAKLTRISALTPTSDEINHVRDVAGQPGAITVSTAMLGRGTDIKLHKEPRKNRKGEPEGDPVTSGLNVVCTYLPRERDQLQILGRAGRFGDIGQSRLILDTERIKAHIGASVLPTEFYTATEAYLSRQQKLMDTHAQQQRLIKNAVGDFRLKLTNAYFDFYQAFRDHKDKDSLLQAWQKFFDKTDKRWNEIWPKIAEQLAKPQVDTDSLNGLLQEFKDVVQEEWEAMRGQLAAQIENGTITSFTKAELDTRLLQDVGNITLTATALGLLQTGPTLAQEPLRTTIADKYDPAFVGRAVIYRNFFDGVKAFWENIKAARRGEGPWFPNLKAALNGNMSWSQFFFGTWGTPLPLAPVTVSTPKVVTAAPVTVAAAPAETPEEAPTTSDAKMAVLLGCKGAPLPQVENDDEEDLEDVAAAILHDSGMSARVERHTEEDEPATVAPISDATAEVVALPNRKERFEAYFLESNPQYHNIEEAPYFAKMEAFRVLTEGKELGDITSELAKPGSPVQEKGLDRLFDGLYFARLALMDYEKVSGLTDAKVIEVCLGDFYNRVSREGLNVDSFLELKALIELTNNWLEHHPIDASNVAATKELNRALYLTFKIADSVLSGVSWTERIAARAVNINVGEVEKLVRKSLTKIASNLSIDEEKMSPTPALSVK